MIKNPQVNAMVELVHQLIYNMIVTKDVDKPIFDYIHPWDKTLSFISWEIMDSYHLNLNSTPGQLFLLRHNI